MKKMKKTMIMTIILAMLISMIIPIGEVKAGYDTTAPVVNSVTFKQSVAKPEVLTISVDVTEEETGIIGIDLYFKTDNVSQLAIYRCGTWNNYENGEWEKNPKFSGTYTFTIPVSSKVKSGEYYLSQIDIADVAGNSKSYWFIEDSLNSEKNWWEIQGSTWEKANINVNNGNNILLVKDEFDVDFQTYITNSNIINKLNSMPSGSCAMINFNANNCIAKKEWFDAIKGKDKTIVFSNDGIQWIFKGTDITGTTKNINCAISMRQIDSTEYGSTEKTLKVDFPSNGILPGKAIVRIKANYIYNDWGVKRHIN